MNVSKSQLTSILYNSKSEGKDLDLNAAFSMDSTDSSCGSHRLLWHTALSAFYSLQIVCSARRIVVRSEAHLHQQSLCQGPQQALNPETRKGDPSILKLTDLQQNMAPLVFSPENPTRGNRINPYADLCLLAR